MANGTLSPTHQSHDSRIAFHHGRCTLAHPQRPPTALHPHRPLTPHLNHNMPPASAAVRSGKRCIERFCPPFCGTRVDRRQNGTGTKSKSKPSDNKSPREGETQEETSGAHAACTTLAISSSRQGNGPVDTEAEDARKFVKSKYGLKKGCDERIRPELHVGSMGHREVVKLVDLQRPLHLLSMYLQYLHTGQQSRDQIRNTIEAPDEKQIEKLIELVRP